MTWEEKRREEIYELLAMDNKHNIASWIIDQEKQMIREIMLELTTKYGYGYIVCDVNELLSDRKIDLI